MSYAWDGSTGTSTVIRTVVIVTDGDDNPVAGPQRLTDSRPELIVERTTRHAAKRLVLHCDLIRIPVEMLIIAPSPLTVIAIAERTVAHRGVADKEQHGVVAVTALAGGATALGGPLTFVGLAVPLMVRRIVGARQGAIALWSIVVGAAWVCGADVVSRLVLAPSEVPVGVIVALIGAPFFILGARGKGMS